MTLLERFHCWAMARIQAVNAHLAFQRGDNLHGAEFENDARRYQSALDRDAMIRGLQ